MSRSLQLLVVRCVVQFESVQVVHGGEVSSPITIMCKSASLPAGTVASGTNARGWYLRR